jgi:hypothetical protein
METLQALTVRDALSHRRSSTDKLHEQRRLRQSARDSASRAVLGENLYFNKRQMQANGMTKTLLALHHLGEQREAMSSGVESEMTQLKACVYSRHKTLFGAVSASVNEINSALDIASEELQNSQQGVRIPFRSKQNATKREASRESLAASSLMEPNWCSSDSPRRPRRSMMKTQNMVRVTDELSREWPAFRSFFVDDPCSVRMPHSQRMHPAQAGTDQHAKGEGESGRIPAHAGGTQEQCHTQGWRDEELLQAVMTSSSRVSQASAPLSHTLLPIMKSLPPSLPSSLPPSPCLSFSLSLSFALSLSPSHTHSLSSRSLCACARACAHFCSPASSTRQIQIRATT